MSFNIKNNWFLSLSAISIALGITLGTGSLYRYIYSYNLIMAVTLFIMVIVIFYQHFLPISTNLNSDSTVIKQNISIPGVILISFMLFTPLFSDILNEVTSLEIAFFYIAMFSLSFLLERQFRKKILNAYLIIIVVLSIISILMIFLFIFTEYLSYLPHKMGLHFNANYYYIFSINPESVWIRNQSIFWEPGAFVFHLIFATLLAYRNDNKLLIIILIIACITTFSTTAIIFLLLLYIYHIFLGKNRLKMFMIISSIVIISFIISILIVGNPLIPQLIFQALVGKFIPNSNNFISFANRNHFAMEAFKMFTDNILFGAGHYATAIKLQLTNSSGLAGLVAELGLFGVFCIFLYTRYFFYKFGLIAIPITLIWLNGEFLQYSPLAIYILADSADDFANILFPQRGI
ncbi:MAG: hypothetical protein MUP82_00900 [Candidatus Marinimicrobia bacterium]|nr:hypothetical protein [Candidatus Neomarinimicrobiota bacterium]